MKWHKGSRFWMTFPSIVLISGALTWFLEAPEIWVATIPALVLGAGAQTTVRHHHDGKNGDDIE